MGFVEYRRSGEKKWECRILLNLNLRRQSRRGFLSQQESERVPWARSSYLLDWALE